MLLGLNVASLVITLWLLKVLEKQIVENLYILEVLCP